MRTSSRGIVISCFDYTGNMARPWADAGYSCFCVDLRHEPGERRDGNIRYIGADMLDWLPPNAPVAFAAFFPPCTHVAVSGARWFKDKGLGALLEAIRLFQAAVRLAEWSQAPHLIENPVSTISSYWRKPDYTFNPCDYAGYLGGESDFYTKKTCLWVGGGFVMPAPKPLVPVDGSRMWRLPPSADRASLLSETPKGFAQAVFEANRPCDSGGETGGSYENCA